jgi:HPr kinase/phosphorylase
MDSRSSISVTKFFRDNEKMLKLRWVAGKKGADREITEESIHRPGLALAGFFDYFADKRVNIIGMAEYAYLNSLDETSRDNAIRRYLEEYFPCVIFARGLDPFPLFIELANEIDMPIFVSSMITYHVINDTVIYLERELSPSVAVIGTLVEVQGTGVLIRGPSGVGKSECALSLIKNGAALVADDVVRISQLGGSSLIGSAKMSEMYGFIEIRGLGLINVIQLFGVSAFREKQEIDIVVTLKHWEEVGRIERSGLETAKYRILEMDVPHITLPVAPGRDLAGLVTIAAQEYRMRALGLHAGKVLNEEIIKRITPAKG